MDVCRYMNRLLAVAENKRTFARERKSAELRGPLKEMLNVDTLVLRYPTSSSSELYSLAD